MKAQAVGKCSIKGDKDYLAKMQTLLQQTAAQPPLAKMNRLIQEITDLGNNLPLEATKSIFVRYD